MSGRSRYRKIMDLFVDGTELILPNDGEPVVLWVQALNKFEIEEARQIAQTARARYTLAVKQVGSPEYDQVAASFRGRPTEVAINELVAIKESDHFLDAHHELEVDPEWKERFEIMRRAEEIEHLDEDHPERLLHMKVVAEWVEEVNRRSKDNSDYYRRSLERMSDEDLLAEYLEEWLLRRSAAIARDEMAISEVYFAARVCDATPEPGTAEFSQTAHEGCNHKDRIFASRDEVREISDDLWDLISVARQKISMSPRDAKNSHRPLSSSEQSQQPSSVEGSESSTGDATL